MTDERERREFNAGLSEEVDAWLRGDTSRREFLTRFMLLGGAAMLPGLGYTASGSKAWAAMADVSKVELADPSTPLGEAQAAAVKASTRARRTGRRIAPCRPPSSQGQGRHAQPDLRGRSAGARAEELFRAPVAGVDGHELQRRRTAAPRPIFQADRRAYRQLRRLRHPRHRTGLDPRTGQRRRHRADRRLCREIHEQGRSRRLSPALQIITLYKGKRWGVFDDGDQCAFTIARTSSAIQSCRRPTKRNSTSHSPCRRPGTTIRRSPSSSPTSWRPTSTARPISARSAVPATSSPSCSSSAPTAASSSTPT